MIWGDCIVEIIKPIVRLDYDELLAKTSIELYKDIPVNFIHITDTEIGKVLDVYADEKDPNLVIARMFIKDEVWEKYGDKFGGCSVEVAFNPEGTVVIPTQVSILTYDVPPAIEDTNRFTLEKYSKAEIYTQSGTCRILGRIIWGTNSVLSLIEVFLLMMMANGFDSVIMDPLDKGIMVVLKTGEGTIL